MNYEADIENCIKILTEGGIILYPTDTIWGLGCDATNTEAVSKIYTTKKREENKSMIILLADEKQIGDYAKTPSQKIKSLMQETEKPLTIIYPEAKHLAANVVNGDGSIAIRVVKDDFCEALIRRFGKAIVSTSANVSGERSPANFNEISVEIKNAADYIVQHKRDDLSTSKPSRILKWNGGDEVITIRE
jgi:L-threonylcarbamoyladenylate synthase